MYHPQNNGHWQQPPPPPAGGPPPPPPQPISVEAAAAYANYGYGSVPQRGGVGGHASRPGGHGRGRPPHQAPGNHQHGRTQPGQHNSYAPMSANLPYSPGQAATAGGAGPSGIPYQGGNAPPAKRARYDSNAPGAAASGLPPHPGYPASLPAGPVHPGTASHQHPLPTYQPMGQQLQQHHQYQPPLPQGPSPPQGPSQPYYQQPHQQQQYQQPMQGFVPVQGAFQYQPQLHQPMSQPQAHQPFPSQVRQGNITQASPTLAVAPMKANPGSHNNRNKGKGPAGPSSHNQSQPPPPPASIPLPPPPPAEAGSSRGNAGTIKLSPKGAASLPPIPTGAATLPPNPTTAAAPAPSASLPSAPPAGPSIPTGPRGAGFKRDTRPLPSQSRHVETNLRGESSSGKASPAVRGKPSTGPPRGPRGRGTGRGGFDVGRPSSGRPGPRREERSEPASSSKGYKRTFSQTGGPPTGPRGATRPRTDSNATAPSVQLSKRESKKLREARDRTAEGSPAPSSNGKGLKRTLTDFRIESLEISALKWVWKAMPLSHILARMNLKEQEEMQSRRDASMGVKTEETAEPVATTSAALPSVAEEPDKPDVQADEHDTNGETRDSLEDITETKAPEASAQPSSTEMAKSDSRPEKRKHARDEEEEEDENRYRKQAEKTALEKEGDHLAGQDITVPSLEEPVQEARSTYPKEVAASLDDTSPAGAVSDVPQDEPTSSLAEAATQQEPKPAAGTQILEADAASADTPNDSMLREGDDASSDTSSSGDEVAAEFIVSKSKSPSKPDAASEDHDASGTRSHAVADDTESVADASVRLDEQDEDEEDGRSRRDLSYAPDDTAKQGVPKKLRENSRLRIYFMSPVELEQKDIRRGLLKHKTGSSLPPLKKDTPEAAETTAIDQASADSVARRPGVGQSPAEASTEAAGENVTVQSEAKPDEVADNAETASKGNSADLDGEPLLEAKPEDGYAQTSEDTSVVVKEEEVEDPKLASEQDARVSLAKEELAVLPCPSSDRLSIAYAQNTRRLVIDAEVVEELAIYRAEGKIEIVVRVEAIPKDEESAQPFRAIQGIYVEKACAASEQSYEEIGYESLVAAWGPDEASKPEGGPEGGIIAADQLTPPVHHLLTSSAGASGGEVASSFTIVARLDRAHPLTEAKWVRTGAPDEWMLSCIRESGTVGSASTKTAHHQLPKGESGTSALLNNWREGKGSAWKGKIRVVDPDAPPTFQHALENWLSSTNSRSGFDEARYRFVNTHFQDLDNILEVLLRLIRGGAGPEQQPHARHNASSRDASAGGSNSSQTAAFAVQALASGAPYAEQQTAISLAAFQLFKVGIDAALAAGAPKADIERKVGEVVRSLPYPLIFRSLDSMFGDFKRLPKQ